MSAVTLDPQHAVLPRDARVFHQDVGLGVAADPVAAAAVQRALRAPGPDDKGGRGRLAGGSGGQWRLDQSSLGKPGGARAL